MQALPPVKDATDPLSEVLSLLELENAQCSRLEASGSWALSFVSRPRVKIVALLRGTCWITVPDATPYRLTAGDTFLLKTTRYIIASDTDVPPIDGAAIFGAEPSHVVRLGG